ncbi:MAG: hypothetical protein ACI4T3_04365 [Lactobacillus sp.]
MEVFIGFIELAFAIALLWTIFSWFKSRKSKNKEMFKKSLAVTVALLVVGAVLVNIFVPSKENSTSNRSTTNKVAKKVKKNSNQSKQSSSSSSKEDNPSDTYTAKQVKKINKQLILDLKDDQDSATSGDKNYDWSQYVLKIKVNRDKNASVYVDGSFMDLSEGSRKIVGEKTIGLIGRSIVTAGVDMSLEEGRQGVYLNFYNGPQAIGHSKYSDHTEFKWYH